MKRKVRNCQYCSREYEPIRYDQKYCSRECLDRWFCAERKQALAVYRAQQRFASLFLNATQPLRSNDDDDNQELREAG